MASPVEPKPTASQTLVEAHETPGFPIPPSGKVWGVHLEPPSVVPKMASPRIVPPLWRVTPTTVRPTASQTLVEAHETPKSVAAAVEEVWVVQVEPPSVVPRMMG
jgi:hypothetical protein